MSFKVSSALGAASLRCDPLLPHQPLIPILQALVEANMATWRRTMARHGGYLRP